MKTFNLPDLGEGLPDAEIVNWLVKEGDTVSIDQPMVEMETAKAVVEVPSPFNGVITHFYGQPGDIILTGAPLVDIDTGENSPLPESKTESSVQSETQAAAVEKEGSETLSATAEDIEIFNLPDLGEGLPDAEIVNWLVKQGDKVSLHQPMVEMETAKAVVEVPAPHDGFIHQLYGQAGDIIKTGEPLVSFTTSVLKQASTGSEKPKGRKDAGTVVGTVEVGNTVTAEKTSTVAGSQAKITPVIKALARKLKVDLSTIKPTGKAGAITQADVKNAAKKCTTSPSKTPETITEAMVSSNTHKPLAFKASPAVRAHAGRLGVDLQNCQASGPKGSITKADVDNALNQPEQPSASTAQTAAPRPVAPTVHLSGDAEAVRGARRAMAQAMTASHQSVVPVTLMDDVDISSWPRGTDATARMLRAICYASKIEPALNAWFDGDKMERILHPHVHVGIAVDTPAGLYVPVLKNADSQSAADTRQELNRLMQSIEAKTIKPGELTGGTISLSNYGTIAGRYGTPVVTLPQVAILGAGRYRDELKISDNGISKHRMLPLSLSFDHRACTGGEGARFLAALMTDLQSAV